MVKAIEYQSREEMEYHFKWVRKHFYTDLLKLFLVKDVDDYNDYKYDIYDSFHSLDFLKYDEIAPSIDYVKNILLEFNDLEKNVNIAIDWYNKRNKSMFKDGETYIKIGRLYYEKDDLIYPSDISSDSFDKEKFINFATEYVDWLVNKLLEKGDVSFYHVNKKLDEILGWDEKFEFDKKRALKEARENRFNQSIDISFNDKEKLGICFIELFDKIYKKEENLNIEETINEMQFLFDYIKKTIYTNGREPMLDREISDGFLTAGAYPEDFVEMNREEIVAYDKFSTYLLCYESVLKAFELIK